jgi:hypothetical protein
VSNVEFQRFISRVPPIKTVDLLFGLTVAANSSFLELHPQKSHFKIASTYKQGETRLNPKQTLKL